ncbi:nucleolar protein 12 [Protopterus annectens]|uniref:nucleolar protein 12 n=1 Tax=Protopterus annectens TaxID=7888 RepID=UPI001CFB3162|nr:nucleolar protein 12 [Protopterus annectens]
MGTSRESARKHKVEKRILIFDEDNRREFLTGFHKRKVERRKAALEEIKMKLKEEEKKMKEEKHTAYLDLLKTLKEALEEADELDHLVTSKVEALQYDHPRHTVTVTTISDLDLDGAKWLTTGTSKAEEQSFCKESNDNDDSSSGKHADSVPRKANNPLLSKR